MKKYFLCGLAVLALTGCSSGVSQSDYESVSAELQTAEAEKESLQTELESVRSDLDAKSSENESLSEGLSNLEKYYQAYQESMAPYESLSQLEAESKTAELESIKASSEAAESQSIAESESASVAESLEAEKVGYDTGITYDQLARNPDENKGKKVKFKGYVAQILEGDSDVQMRLATKGHYDNILYCDYDKSLVSSRILEGDTITIYGVSLGTITYTSSMNVPITIPAVSIDRIDQ